MNNTKPINANPAHRVFYLGPYTLEDYQANAAKLANFNRMSKSLKAGQDLQILVTKMLAGGYNGKAREMHTALGNAAEVFRVRFNAVTSGNPLPSEHEITRLLRERDALRDALNRLVSVCDAYDNGQMLPRAICAAKDQAKTALALCGVAKATSEATEQDKAKQREEYYKANPLGAPQGAPAIEDGP